MENKNKKESLIGAICFRMEVYMKNRKIIKTGIVTLVVFGVVVSGIFVAASMVPYANGEKSENTQEENREAMPILSEEVKVPENQQSAQDILDVMSMECGDTIEYEDYVFTLKEYFFDKNSGTGLFHVTVENENIDMKKEFAEIPEDYDGAKKYFIQDRFIEKFFINPCDCDTMENLEGCKIVEAKYEMQGNVLHIYMPMFLHDSFIKYSFDNCLYLYDMQKETETLNEMGTIATESRTVIGKFELEDTGCGRTFDLADGGKMIVTPYRLCFYKHHKGFKELSIQMKDGTLIQLMDDGELLDATYAKSDSGSGENRFQDIATMEYINCEEIEHVSLNGVIYTY